MKNDGMAENRIFMVMLVHHYRGDGQYHATPNQANRGNLLPRAVWKMAKNVGA